MRNRAIGILALLAMLLGAAASSGKVRWRAQLISWKLRGELPLLSWGDVAVRLVPSGSREGRKPGISTASGR